MAVPMNEPFDSIGEQVVLLHGCGIILDFTSSALEIQDLEPVLRKLLGTQLCIQACL